MVPDAVLLKFTRIAREFLANFTETRISRNSRRTPREFPRELHANSHANFTQIARKIYANFTRISHKFEISHKSHANCRKCHPDATEISCKSDANPTQIVNPTQIPREFHANPTRISRRISRKFRQNKLELNKSYQKQEIGIFRAQPREKTFLRRLCLSNNAL